MPLLQEQGKDLWHHLPSFSPIFRCSTRYVIAYQNEMILLAATLYFKTSDMLHRTEALFKNQYCLKIHTLVRLSPKLVYSLV